MSSITLKHEGLSVTIEHDSSGLTAEEMWHLLLRPALLAIGYHHDSVDDLTVGGVDFDDDEIAGVKSEIA